MDIIKKYLRPFNFHRRDREFFRRHAEGPVSSRDIMEIEYGTFPPKGWTVRDKPHQHTPVEIYTPLTDQKSGIGARLLMTLLTLGYVKPESKRLQHMADGPMTEKPALALNKLIFSPAGQVGVLYLCHAILTKLAVAAATLNPVTVFLQAPLLALMTFATSLRNQPLTQLLTLPFRPATDTVGHENVHVLQNRDPYETRTGYNMLRNSFKKRTDEIIMNGGAITNARNFTDNVLSFNLCSYFRNDYEIQARMHTLLTHNYRRWGRMPETRHELWAALIDAGLRAPQIIHDELASSNEDLRDFHRPGLAATFRRAALQLGSPHISELNTGYWALLRHDLKEDYWLRTLPYIYGHLTELSGDEAGLLKMGYTGPVLEKSGPVPFLPWERQKFLAEAEAKEYRHNIREAKETEARRGLWFHDSEDDNLDKLQKRARMFDDDDDETARHNLRATAGPGVRYINNRAPS